MHGRAPVVSSSDIGCSDPDGFIYLQGVADFLSSNGFPGGSGAAGCDKMGKNLTGAACVDAIPSPVKLDSMCRKHKNGRRLRWRLADHDVAIDECNQALVGATRSSTPLAEVRGSWTGGSAAQVLSVGLSNVFMCSHGGGTSDRRRRDRSDWSTQVEGRIVNLGVFHLLSWHPR